MKINGVEIGEGCKPYVIAEIGANHQGDVVLCKEIILAAQMAGADAVKLQKRNNRELYTEEMYNKPYDSENAFGSTYGEHRENLEFDFLQMAELRDYAEKIGITLFSTVWDFSSLYSCAKLGLPVYKFASGDLTNIPLITKAASHYHTPLIISTGGATWEDMDRVYNRLVEMKAEFAFLHCVASYPNKADELNLQAISQMRDCYPKAVIGWSSHYSGVDDAVYAYGYGARIIEKHFTVNRALKGTDQAFSLEPHGMQKMVNYLSDAARMRGTGEKQPMDSEKEPLRKMSKSIYPVRPLFTGEVVTKDNTCLKSPGGGLPPYEWESIIGKVLTTDLGVNEPLTWKVVQ